MCSCGFKIMQSIDQHLQKCIQSRWNSRKLWQWHYENYELWKFNFNLIHEIIKLTICYLKDTFLMRVSFEIFILFYLCRFHFLFFSVCYYHYHYCFIASQRWFLTYIYSNFESTFFGFSNLDFFIESLYASNYIYSFYSFLFSLSFLLF